MCIYEDYGFRSRSGLLQILIWSTFEFMLFGLPTYSCNKSVSTAPESLQTGWQVDVKGRQH